MIGGVAGLLVVPLMWAKLPESQAFLAATAGQRRAGDARSEVVRGRLLLVSIGLWVASFMGLLLVYGLNTWLPQDHGARRATPSTPASRCCSPSTSAPCSGCIVSGRIADRRGNKVDRAGLVQRRRRRAGPDGDQAGERAPGLRRGAASPASSSSARRCWSTRSSATSTRRRSAAPRSAWPPASAGSAPSSDRSSAARWSPPALAYPWGFFAFAGAAVLAVVALLDRPRRPRATRRNRSRSEPHLRGGDWSPGGRCARARGSSPTRPTAVVRRLSRVPRPPRGSRGYAGPTRRGGSRSSGRGR